MRALGIGIHIGAARDEGAERARARGRAGRDLLPAAGLRLLHPPRPARLSRAVRQGGRPPVAAHLAAAARPAARAARRGARADRAGEFHHRPSLHRRRAERRPRHRAFRRSGGQRRCRRRRRRADRLRRHPFGGARAVLSGRGAVLLSRLQPVARHDTAEAVSHRRQHRPDRRAAFDDDHLSAAQRHRRGRQPARQLGLRDRARRGGAGRLEQARAGWKTSSRPIRTGYSTGWTCRR